MSHFDAIADLDRQSVLHPFTYLKDHASGVSGGPVFQPIGDEIYILGTISAYYPNVRGMGDTLPGLSFAQGVAHFHETIAKVKSLDEARKTQKQPVPALSPPEPKRAGSPRAAPKAKKTAKKTTKKKTAKKTAKPSRKRPR